MEIDQSMAGVVLSAAMGWAEGVQVQKGPVAKRVRTDDK